MIVPMRKVTFLGLTAQKELFLQRLQEAGVVHLILPAEPAEPAEVLKELSGVREARRFLSRLVQPEPDKAADSAKEIVQRREELSHQENRVQTRLAVLRKERDQLAAWGDFEPADVKLLRERGLWVAFYRCGHRTFAELDLSGSLVVQAEDLPGEVAFAVFAREPMDLGLAEEKLPARGLAAVQEELAALEAELAKVHEGYRELAAAGAPLAEAERDLGDLVEYHRASLNSGVELEGRVFIVSCWSPVGEKELLDRLGDDLVLAHHAEDPGPQERVPVLLSNSSAMAPGEDLVQVYSHPNYLDFDPSGWVLYCFAVFFGMILGDAGYGACLLVMTLFVHKRFAGPGPVWQRALLLMYLLSGSVILFGVISASYFGIALGPGNPLTKLMLLNFGTKAGQNTIMLVSIIIGMSHISLSLAIRFKRDRDWPSLGWILVIWAGFFLARQQMGGGAAPAGSLWVMLAGLALVLAFTSNSKNIAIRLLGGLNGLLGIVQVFSDVLSYLRLFALGIATVYMAQTFNMLAADISKGLPWVGWLAAALVLIAGHAVNLGLGVMGGVIHGLRLNFLEWYRWSFEGDGLPYKAFRLGGGK